MTKKTILKIAISSALIIFLLLKIDRVKLAKDLASMNPYYIPIILGLLVLNYFISSVRWKRLLSIYEGTDHVSVWKLTKLYFEGSFFNNFLPTSVGGDVFKAVALGKLIGSHSNSFAATFMERFSGVLILAVLGTVGMVLRFGKWGILISVVFWIATVVGIRLIGVIGNKFTKLKKFSEAIYLYRHRPDILIYALVTSVFVQLCTILTQYFIFIALGFHISLSFSFIAFPVIIIAGFIIPSENSFGVQDILYAAFFTSVGVPVEGAFSASIVHHVAKLIVSLLGGFIYAVEK